MKIAATGHRKFEHDQDAVYEAIYNLFEKFNPDEVIIGMAQGFDMLVGCVALDQLLPYTAVHPWEGYIDSKYIHEAYRPLYKQLTYFAHENIYLPGPVGKEGLFARNRFMVDRADGIIAYYNGKPSGTMNAVNYANKQKKKVRNVYETLGK